MVVKRWAVDIDYDGHWYLFPADIAPYFWDWLMSQEPYSENVYNGPDFEEYRLPGGLGGLTFTDPRRD